ncbi:hypothetical protein LSTR_LSTR015368 [Laodelphax striatellus]|uniref:28S ribosomal protein S17, mitochondrial n=1 Tax=Laodelphax striatellus TaxID=195883 RepID=A0A482WIQ7_LAOST|nr:hypothetical protein LSTR_LSTR015368 [Laodelphax striatellus]
MAIARSSMLLGKCFPCVKKNASKIVVKRMVLDKNLLMYFDEEETYFAHDPNKICKTNDIVLIEELPQKLTKLITHRVMEVVFPHGDVTDPITGKKVIRTKYRDELEETAELYGKTDRGYDYESAPPRGWQEDKKDFSHLETYHRYSADDKNPNAVDK